VSTAPASLLRSLLHNFVVVLVGFGVAWLGKNIDAWLGLPAFKSALAMAGGSVCLAAGFSLRVWAAFHFYQQQMKVISLSPQGSLITSGPFKFSRNPLYLGGNLFIFLGASLCLGSPAGVLITFGHLPLVDLMIRREEKQLAEKFGAAWVDYKKRVRRWL
jgi:protein-S-isoprenylcysteine O-methyltransferase Ste14